MMMPYSAAAEEVAEVLLVFVVDLHFLLLQ